jgi:ubiquinone biosynthesis protein
VKKLRKRYKNIKRFQSIVLTFVRYGFGDIINRLRIDILVKISKKIIPDLEKSSTSNKTRAERLRLACEELGPTFVKLGQMLSLRPDIIPEGIANEFRKLQDAVPPFPIHQVRDIIQTQLKSPVDKLFKSFSDKPVAAASIAQVHRACTFNDEEIAIKIQRPGIRSIIETDLDILFDLASLAEKHIPDIRAYNPVEIVKEFSISIHNELDFLREGRNIELFLKRFENDEHVYIPKVYWGLTSDCVLTMEYIDGIKASELEKLDAAGLDRKTIAINGACWVLKQIFDYGFFHADPHPGNILVMENNVIAPLDYGMIGIIDGRMKEEIGNALLAFVKKDVDKLIKALINIKVIEDSENLEGFRWDIKNFINYYYNIQLSQIKIGKVLTELIEIIQKHHIRIPPDFSLMTKSLVTVEALGKNLYPDFEIISIAEPFVKELLIQKYNPKKNLRDFLEALDDYSYLFKNMPFELRLIINKIKSGKLNIQFEHQGLDNLILNLDKSSNRLSFSIVIAALLVGSSLIIHINKGPSIFGLPVIGLAGYLISAVFGLWLVIAIMRSGKL